MEVEVGFKLKNDFNYYDNLLKDHGLLNDKVVITHDIYYTNKDLDNLSENDIKNACIRLRSVDDSDYLIQNNLISDIKDNFVLKDNLNSFESIIFKYGYKKIFDTKKKDYHYYKDGMNSKIQIQDIDDIGLMLYYDNSNYYEFDIDVQRRMLIDELNSYGFDFDYNELCLDKLRTLFYKKEMYSKNICE